MDVLCVSVSHIGYTPFLKEVKKKSLLFVLIYFKNGHIFVLTLREKYAFQNKYGAENF